MAIFKKRSLKVRDDEKTNAAELTLRQSIYPICLVTILFFLWVCVHPFNFYIYAGEKVLISDDVNRVSRMDFSIH